MSNYRVIVRTCDEYINALKPFMHQFNKYWSHEQEVLIGGFTQPSFPLLPNFHFHSIGASNLYPVNLWSDATLDFLSVIDDDVFVFMLEDWWLNGKVAVSAIQECVDEARSNPNILRIDLIGDRYYTNKTLYHDETIYKDLGRVKLIQSPWDAPYQLAIAASVYRRDQFIKCLPRKLNPWDTETWGTNKLRELGENAPIVLGTTLPLLNYANGYKQNPEKTKRGKHGKDAVMIETYDLTPDDVAALIDWGLL